jgi:hypothetical protein
VAALLGTFMLAQYSRLFTQHFEYQKRNDYFKTLKYITLKTREVLRNTVSDIKRGHFFL